MLTSISNFGGLRVRWRRNCVFGRSDSKVNGFKNLVWKEIVLNFLSPAKTLVMINESIGAGNRDSNAGMHTRKTFSLLLRDILNNTLWSWDLRCNQIHLLLLDFCIEQTFTEPLDKDLIDLGKLQTDHRCEDGDCKRRKKQARERGKTKLRCKW